MDSVAEMEVEVEADVVEAVDESRFSFEEPYTFLYAFFLIMIQFYLFDMFTLDCPSFTLLCLNVCLGKRSSNFHFSGY